MTGDVTIRGSAFGDGTKASREWTGGELQNRKDGRDGRRKKEGKRL